jgi:hypothetical protein
MLDEVLDSAAVELDPARRVELYAETQPILVEDAGIRHLVGNFVNSDPEQLELFSRHVGPQVKAPVGSFDG